MSYEKADLINYRLRKAHTTLDEAKSLIEQGYIKTDPPIVCTTAVSTQ